MHRRMVFMWKVRIVVVRINGDGNAKVTINNAIGDDHAVTIDLKGDLYRP
mgnify:CR=1 FL=1